MITRTQTVLLLLILSLVAELLTAAPLRIEKGDRIVWIGNTFAERMQYFGGVEARLHARYPKHDLVVRNLAWPADTVSRRPRPKSFGDLHHYLSELRADVVLACYGFNETWDYGGESGISKFRDDLTKLLRSVQERQCNGTAGPVAAPSTMIQAE